MILGLRTALYPAPDIEAGKAWYARALGVEPYFDQPFYVGFAVGRFELGLVPDATPGDAGAQPLWGVDGISAEVERLLALGPDASTATPAVSQSSPAPSGGSVESGTG